MRRAAALLSFAVAAGASLDASANGKFPAADQLVVAPNNPDQIVARTTFGFLVTNNAGADWDLICESAAGYQDIEPGVAITGDGTLFTGLFEGVSVAHGDLCSWSLTLSGIATDVSISKSDPATAIAITRDTERSYYFESPDHGDVFVEVGTPLPDGFFAATVDVAPTDPSRIYMTGSGMFVRSTDHGQTWTSLPLPGTDEMIRGFIGALDPADPDRVYVRLSKTAGGLLVTSDGGDTWTAIDTGIVDSELRGLAVSPDGSKIAIGGEYDGLWMASTDDFNFEKISGVAIRCLTWTEAGLYACVNEELYADGFIVGLSRDEGVSFEPLLSLACVRGPLECPAGTSVAQTCPAEWPALADRLDAPSCGGVDPGVGGGSGTGSGSGSSTSSGAGAGSATPPGSGSSEDGGCATRGGGDEHAWWWLAAVCGCVLRRRRS